MKNGVGFHDDDLLLSGLKRSDRDAFSELFDRYYVDLVMFCGTFICNVHECEDIVTNVFIALWERREELRIRKSVRAYLVNAVKNRAFNEIRNRRIRDEHIRNIGLDSLPGVYDVDDYILYSDMKTRIEKAVGSFTEEIRESYEMYMEEGLKSAEIAGKLNVSQRTVERRLNKALSILRGCTISLILMIITLGIWR